MGELLNDIVAQIFLHLYPYSVVTFRSVCKQWRKISNRVMDVKFKDSKVVSNLNLTYSQCITLILSSTREYDEALLQLFDYKGDVDEDFRLALLVAIRSERVEIVKKLLNSVLICYKITLTQLLSREVSNRVVETCNKDLLFLVFNWCGMRLADMIVVISYYHLAAKCNNHHVISYFGIPEKSDMQQVFEIAVVNDSVDFIGAILDRHSILRNDVATIAIDCMKLNVVGYVMDNYEVSGTNVLYRGVKDKNIALLTFLLEKPELDSLCNGAVLGYAETQCGDRMVDILCKIILKHGNREWAIKRLQQARYGRVWLRYL